MTRHKLRARGFYLFVFYTDRALRRGHRGHLLSRLRAENASQRHLRAVSLDGLQQVWRGPELSCSTRSHRDLWQSLGYYMVIYMRDVGVPSAVRVLPLSTVPPLPGSSSPHAP